MAAVSYGQAQGFDIPNWQYQNQEPFDIVGSIEKGIGLGNLVMQQPNLKRGRDIQKMQQKQVLSGELPITQAQTDSLGLVQGTMQDRPSYESELAAQQALTQQRQAQAQMAQMEAANFGQPEPLSPVDQARINYIQAQEDAVRQQMGLKEAQAQMGMQPQVGMMPQGQPQMVEGIIGEDEQGNPVYGMVPSTTQPIAPLDLTPGEKKIDSEFAGTFEEWNAGGGMANAQANLDRAKSGLLELERNPNSSGPWIGLIPPTVRKLVPPLAAGEEARAAIENSIQSTMKQTLGGQFAKVEGDNLLKRTFDPQAKPEVNARRARSVILQMENIARQKDAASNYFSQYGTLKGYKTPKLLTGYDIDPNIPVEDLEGKKQGGSTNTPTTTATGGIESAPMAGETSTPVAPPPPIEKRQINVTTYTGADGREYIWDIDERGNRLWRLK